MSERTRARVLAGTGILVLALLTLLTGGDAKGQAQAQDQGCSSDVRASVSGKEKRGSGVEWTFKVEVSSSARCADVSFDLVADERTPDGKTSQRRIGYRKQVEGGSGKSRLVRYTERDGVTLQRWAFESTGCTPCPR